ncbi:MAG: hypothetical protein PF443_00580 [Allgaiera sp.]|jgi:hypothetical protein|nr:hypothetical protein [Allgaiera sp.]
MPRKTDPRVGERTDDIPTDFADDLVFGEDFYRLIPATVSSECFPDLVDDIRHIVGRFLWAKKAGPRRYSRAEAMAALDALMKGGDFSIEALSELNERAWDMLYDELAGSGGDLFMLRHLRTNPVSDAETAAAAMRARKYFEEARPGREVDLALRELVANLCLVWETFTGQDVTLSNKGKHLAYRQEPQSEGGRFILSVIRYFWPDVVPSQVSRELRDYVQRRSMSRE